MRIVKIFRDRSPYSVGLVWCLKWDNGKEVYTLDAASGRDRFRLLDELRMRQGLLCDKLKAQYLKLENLRGFIRANKEATK